MVDPIRGRKRRHGALAAIESFAADLFDKQALRMAHQIALLPAQQRS